MGRKRKPSKPLPTQPCKNCGRDICPIPMDLCSSKCRREYGKKNVEIPKHIKHRMLFGKPTTRQEWAKEIHDFIEVIEGSTVYWDEHNLKILDDAYDYCDVYGLKEMRDNIKELHTNFFTGKEMAIDMNYLREFFHEEWNKHKDYEV